MKTIWIVIIFCISVVWYIDKQTLEIEKQTKQQNILYYNY